MRSLNTNKVLVSVFRSSLRFEANNVKHNRAIDLLKREGIQFRIVKGFYKGTQELAFLLESTDIVEHEKNLEVALNLARLFNQDSVLQVSNDNLATLHRMTQGPLAIGVFTEVTREVALDKDSYTFCPLTDRYFVTV